MILATVATVLSSTHAFTSLNVQKGHRIAIGPLRMIGPFGGGGDKDGNKRGGGGGGGGLDLVTYLRTEFISAALCTNQTPRAADVCLQLGVEDGRAVNFVPRTVRAFVTSSSDPSGELPVSAKRQLRQQAERRGAGVELVLRDQRSDDLSETEDESVDVVVSLQAAAPMAANGLDWRASVRESARVLRPGGRLLFVERTELDGARYADYVRNLRILVKGENEDDDEAETTPVFDEVGTDDVDLVLVPHVAGVAIKSEDAGLTKKEREQRVKDEKADRYAELSISAFERGRKRRKRKKKGAAEASTTTTEAEGEGAKQ